MPNLLAPVANLHSAHVVFHCHWSLHSCWATRDTELWISPNSITCLYGFYV